MHFPAPFKMLRLSLGLMVAASEMSECRSIPAEAKLPVRCDSSNSSCDRTCMTNMVELILDSMVAHDPFSLPVALNYKATENSHPAALGMMTSWRTITKTGRPSLLAIDTTNGTAYFALDVSEGNDSVPNVLRGRVKVVNQLITELELFINRYRGDHGFSFSAKELPDNYADLMNPPDNRTKASRETLYDLSEALFADNNDYAVNVSDSCQFTEIGWKVVDPGTNSTGSLTPLGCSWPDDHPVDTNARVALVIDEDMGFVVTSGMIQGKAYPYENISAFIPDQMTSAQEAQVVWMKEMTTLGILPMVVPTAATGETLEVLQFYNGKLQAMQINVYLSGPNMTSAWL
ncbi:hypothetical protein SEUCBS139899_010685 [Sporothrix eucalyptigena]|uniref:Uncharacterized protein n=1 Tax=Sporothrix eucalyptigena TaxID=1812306 RepID=A0ABP0D1Z9_9PEZI